MKELFINFRKPKNVMSNMTFKEHKVFEAHTSDQPGYVRYVEGKAFDEIVKKLTDENTELQRQLHYQVEHVDG